MRTVLRLILSLLFVFTGQIGYSHALDPGYLDLRQLAPGTWRVQWRIPDVNGQPMNIDARLPDHCTPARGPDTASDGVAWVSAWIVECETGLAGHSIAIDGLEAQRNDVLVRLQPLTSEATTLRFTPDEPVLTIPENPTTWTVFLSYFQLGFEHILEGWDHLLFIFALLVLVRSPWRLVGAVTAFTVAHSITLALATLGIVQVPGPPVEAVIALSIVFLALEILKHKDGQMRLSEQYPWIVCFCFGLLHGLGFAGALADIGLPSRDILAALLAFNIGVEAGQLTFIAVLLGAMSLWRHLAPALLFKTGPIAVPVTGYFIGCVSLFWLVERVSGF